MQDNSSVTFYFEPNHTNEQVLDDYLKLIYNRSVWTQDVVERTYRMRWTIETTGVRESRKSVRSARHDDDYDDGDIYTYIYLYTYMYIFKHVWLKTADYFLFKIFKWMRSCLLVIVLLSMSSWWGKCPILAQVLSTISLVILRGCIRMFVAVSYIYLMCLFFFVFFLY